MKFKADFHSKMSENERLYSVDINWVVEPPPTPGNYNTA